MIKIEAYKNNNFHAEIKQLSIKRNWMDDTWNSHAYHCFPINLCNQMAWGISFPEDISFIWDGISDSSTEHIKIISGHRYVSLARGNATVSFNTGVRLTTDKNTSILQIPVPNDFNLDYLSFSSIISTSFFEGDLPCAIRVIVPNKKILIKANTPISCFLPINLIELQNSQLIFKKYEDVPKNKINALEYSKAIQDYNNQGKWSNFYRNATDQNNNKIGEHQVKSIKLDVVEEL